MSSSPDQSGGSGGEGTRGSGFVHLNTPASIQYTVGQTLSLSALRQRKSRVECVVLPQWMSLWREAFQAYSKEEGYNSFATDVEDERSGNGPILPPSAPQRLGPVRRRAGKALSATDAFFCTSTSPVSLCTSASSAHGGASSCPVEDGGTATTRTTDAANSSGTLGAGCLTAAPDVCAIDGRAASATKQQQDGIAIISHHKITGHQEFVYPDHDGVLSAGVVPQIVVTPEEQAEEEAARAFYISPLAMSEEELAAFEELQALWKSRARSHSFLGAQHRQAAKGAVDPSTTTDLLATNNGRPSKMMRREGVAGGASLASGRGSELEPHAYDEAGTIVEEESTLDQELAEALRMADDLLRFA
ncbi:hypothetical protein JKF63_05767 [Porcisia hertigi]|uniref:Uncharacterized protein n=1 Tax=Porcisia hertigi TaxID=2761500 RepID=A0A836LCD0_9TRYP|nr:hypothetical protein JKF63_05767 [Porcisia hertigi]